MSAPITHRDLPTTITIPPTPPHPHTHTVIFLHGRGDNTRSFVRALHSWHSSRGQTLFAAFPTFRWVFPQAPLRPVANSRPPHAMPQWFDVWSPRDFREREELQVEGLREMVPVIRGLIEREAGELGGRWDRVVLGGISMGSATGVHTLFNLAVPSAGGGRLAAYLGFCARCPFAGRGLQGMREVLGLEGAPGPGEDGVLRRTPVLLEHNADDPLVLVEKGRELRDVLEGFGAQVEWKEYAAGGHWFREPEGVDDVVEFLNRVVVLGESVVGEPGLGEQSVVAADAMEIDT